MQDGINLTSWDKPWPPEIDWLDPYVNLSSLPPDVLDGLFNGFRVTRLANYLSNPDIG